MSGNQFSFSENIVVDGCNSRRCETPRAPPPGFSTADRGIHGPGAARRSAVSDIGAVPSQHELREDFGSYSTVTTSFPQNDDVFESWDPFERPKLPAPFSEDDDDWIGLEEDIFRVALEKEEPDPERFSFFQDTNPVGFFYEIPNFVLYIQPTWPDWDLNRQPPLQDVLQLLCLLLNQHIRDVFMQTSTQEQPEVAEIFEVEEDETGDSISERRHSPSWPSFEVQESEMAARGSVSECETVVEIEGEDGECEEWWSVFSSDVVTNEPETSTEEASDATVEDIESFSLNSYFASPDARATEGGNGQVKVLRNGVNADQSERSPRAPEFETKSKALCRQTPRSVYREDSIKSAVQREDVDSSIDLFFPSDGEDALDDASSKVRPAFLDRPSVPRQVGLSYEDIERCLLDVDVSNQERSAKKSLREFGTFAHVASVGVIPKPLAKEYREDRLRLLSLARMPFNPNDSMHVRLLQEVYRLYTGRHGSERCNVEEGVIAGRRVSPSITGEHWTALGFQGRDPSTDFRGYGILSLWTMLYLYHHNEGEALRLFRESKQNAAYPFAATCIVATSWMIRAVSKGKLNALVEKMDPFKGKQMVGAHPFVDVAMNLFTGLMYKFHDLTKRSAGDVEDIVEAQATVEKCLKMDALLFVKIAQVPGILDVDAGVLRKTWSTSRSIV